MSKRKYLWETRPGQIALFFLIFAMIFNSLAIRSVYRYYPFTDVKNPNIELLEKCNWFYINLWIFLDLLIIAPSLAFFHHLPKKAKDAILTLSILLGLISYIISFYNLILITWP